MTATIPTDWLPEDGYVIGGKFYPRVSRILEAAGIGNSSSIPPWALERGAEIHLVLEQYDLGTLDECPEIYEPRLRAWKAFCADHHFEIDSVEQLVHHAELGYAGRLDRIGTLDGKNCILDIKSSILPPHTAIQLAAYGLAEATRYGNQITHVRVAVAVLKDGTYKHKIYDDPGDYLVWRAALQIFRWKQDFS